MSRITEAMNIKTENDEMAGGAEMNVYAMKKKSVCCARVCSDGNCQLRV